MITGYVRRQALAVSAPVLVADTIDYLTARFVFMTGDWDGLEVWAHFRKGDTAYDFRLDEDGEITADQHLNLTEGVWTVYLTGHLYSGGAMLQRISTQVAEVKVVKSGMINANPFPPLPATVEEQIFAELEDHEERLSDIEQNGTGGGGGTGDITGAVRYDVLQKLTDEQKMQARSNTGAASKKDVDKRLAELSEAIAELGGNTTLNGKRLSVLGTSISTYPNTIPEGYVSYYTAETMPNVNDMWWKKVCDSLGMTLLINNSYSGSCVAKKSGVTIPSGSETVRNMALHDGENAPDIIIVEMGANDFLTNVSVGSYKVSNGTTFDSYAFMGAYAKMIWNMMCKYPNTKIYCATIMPLYQGTDGNPFPTSKTAGGIEAYNEIIKTVASMFGCGVIEFDKCGITTKNLINYTVDGRIHPNANGQTLMANVAKKELLKYTPVLASYIDTSVTGDSSSDSGGEGGENTGEATLLHSYDFTTGEIVDSVSGLAMVNTNVTLDENGAYFSQGNTALEVSDIMNPKNKTFELEFGEVDGSSLVSTSFHKSWCVFTLGANSFRANYLRWSTDTNKWVWSAASNEVFSFDGTVNELSNGILKIDVDSSGNAKFYMNNVLKYEYPSLFGDNVYVGIGKTDGTFYNMTVKKFKIYSNAE